MQLWSWGELKASHGPWTPIRLVVETSGQPIGGAQLLARRLPMPFKQLFYAPRGPFGDHEYRLNVLSELSDWAKGKRAVEFKIEPDWPEMSEWPKGWRKSKNHILIPKTAQVALDKTENELTADMAKKTRQYIRKSTGAGVVTRQISAKSDLAKCLAIYRHTAEQRRFGIHADNYYYDLAHLAGDANRIYLAEKDGETLSFLWNIRSKACEFELYGGTSKIGEELRSNYCLKWHAIVESKKAGTKIYDMNGLLNNGISSFKRGFSSKETVLVGTWDKPLSPLYRAWETILPVAKKTMQKLSRSGK